MIKDNEKAVEETTRQRKEASVSVGRRWGYFFLTIGLVVMVICYMEIGGEAMEQTFLSRAEASRTSTLVLGAAIVIAALGVLHWRLSKALKAHIFLRYIVPGVSLLMVWCAIVMMKESRCVDLHPETNTYRIKNVFGDVKEAGQGPYVKVRKSLWRNGVIDLQGNTVIPLEYRWVWDDGDYFRVEDQQERQGVYRGSDLIIETKYDHIEKLWPTDYFVGELNAKYALFSPDGEEVIPLGSRRIKKQRFSYRYTFYTDEAREEELHIDGYTTPED
ncbi:MAG: hypothetical protein LIP03_09055 [Bacteroidales bacterium]|nr:hypothetical protein [Bacteroidales bacterium]